MGGEFHLRYHMIPHRLRQRFSLARQVDRGRRGQGNGYTEAPLSPDISYVNWFLAKLENFCKICFPKIVVGPPQEQGRHAMQPIVVFEAFFTTPLPLRNFSDSASSTGCDS